MSERPVLVERAGPVATLTLNRPDVLNAINRQMRALLKSELAALSSDDAVRAIVITGAGRAFSAGVDLKEAEALGFGLDDEGEDTDFGSALAACPRPVIAAVRGPAITGGFEIALLCDLIYAAEDARFADTHARVGLLPTWGLSQRLPRLIGMARAKEMSLSARFIDAATAERWGLVNRVFPVGELLSEARRLAEEMAEFDPDGLSKLKALMDGGYAMSFADALRHERKVALVHNNAIKEGAVGAAGVIAKGRASEA
ncbi:MAG: enoyl-CoA hydratase [Caulobacterales bacterium]|nr:enoyl-CoA hydratase [Caulobacterales bacterium]